MNWIANTRGAQGLVYEESTGKSIAVAYEPKDAPLIAAAPELFAALQDAETEIETLLTDLCGDEGPEADVSGQRTLAMIRAALSKARP